MMSDVTIQLVTGLVYLGISGAVIVLVLIVSRELTAWYFKTNEIIELLKKIADKK